MFLVVAFFALLGVGAATLVLSDRIASEWALAEAERTTSSMAENLIAPLLDTALNGTPGGRAALDRVVTTRLSDGSVAMVLVWTPQGVVLYSSDPALEGRVVAPSPELTAAAAGEVVSDLDDMPELGQPRGVEGPLVEVYVPLAVGGRSLVLEAYFSSAAMDRSAALLRERIVPLALGGLVVLQLVQVPLALSMGRRIKRQETERSTLIAANLRASDHERQEIAADVHDGPVQDLAGVSYALGGLRPGLPQAQQVTVDRLVSTVRTAVSSLRRLTVQIYPPDLTGSGLAGAFDDLAGSLRDHGVTVEVDVEQPAPDLTPSAAATLYRTAKEALTNVARHANAQTARVSLYRRGPEAVALTVTDDGIGFGPTGADAPADGHLGLRLLRDRIVHEGGTLTLSNGASGGAVVSVVLPTTPHAAPQHQGSVPPPRSGWDS